MSPILEVRAPTEDPISLDAYVDAVGTVVLDPREEYRSAELGVAFDGRMIYDRDRLRGAFMEAQGWDEDEADEWIDFNVVRSGEVLGRRRR